MKEESKEKVNSTAIRVGKAGERRSIASSTKCNDSELTYLASFMNLNDNGTIVINADHLLEGKKAGHQTVQNIISLNSLNQISSLNEFITRVNDILPNGGLLAGKFHQKKNRPELLPRTLRFKLSSLWNSLYSKLKLTRSSQKKPAKDETNNLPFVEALGRVAAGGFKILAYKQFNEFIYFIAEKVSTPSFKPPSAEGLIFKMKRIGKGGRITEYYKFRTMYLYAEYLQNFVYQQNGLKNGDKFSDDFRVTKLGNFLRKYWIDELPMIVNLLKGDLKLVGVRPLSCHKFNLYSKDVQHYRTKFKPGLIPPFYADMPESFEGLMESEVKYLRLYEKKPLKTDIKYFFKCLYNILIKGARSR